MEDGIPTIVSHIIGAVVLGAIIIAGEEHGKIFSEKYGGFAYG